MRGSDAYIFEECMIWVLIIH